MILTSPLLLPAAFLLCTSLAMGAYPDATPTAKPNPEPALPADFDPFAPPVTTGSPPSGAPMFAEWTRIGGPNDTIAMTGIRFSTFTGLNQGKDTTFMVFGQTTASNQILVPGAICRLDGGQAALQLDPGLPSDSLLLVWAGNKNGYSAPILINETEAWWIGPESAARGTTASVYGRNLAQTNVPPAGSSMKSWVYLKRRGNVAGVWAAVTSVNPYKVDFVIPSNLSTGSYEVWTHNGRGGHYGWSGPLTLTVTKAPAWTGGTYSVKNFGATGDGITDDGSALAAALSNASAHPGSTLSFPNGTYKITNYLTIPANVRLRGTGRDTTVINLSVTNSAESPPQTIYLAGNGIDIENLTLTASGDLPTDPDYYVFVLAAAEGVTDLQLANVLISGQGCDTFYFNPSRRLSFTQCEFIGHNGYLDTASQVFFSNCTFLQTNDADVPIWAYSGQDISVSGCTTQDLDNSDSTNGAGWGLGRWFVGNGYFGAQRHVYLGGNTSTQLGVRPGATNQNSGEQFLWELPNYYFVGPVASATAKGAVLVGYTGNNSTFFPGENDDGIDAEVIVIAGKGLGQHRAIASVNRAAGSITLTAPWSVVPDATSSVAIMTSSEKVAIYGNYLDGKPYIYQAVADNASCGVQAFEGTLDFVVDGNTFHDTRTGISLWGYSDLHETKPVYFGAYINNVFENNRWGVRWITQAPNIGVNFLGNVFRGNTVNGTVFDGFLITSDTGTNPAPWVDLNVIEQTAAINLPLGITRSGAPGFTLNTIVQSNSFACGSAAFGGSTGLTFVADEAPCLRGNSWSGYETTYAGVLPGAILETPFRALTVEASANGAAASASLQVWDAGTAPLAWSAKSNVGWLKLVNKTGTVQGENDVNLVSFTCNPHGLLSGSYTGQITLTGSAQTKVVTISFLVN